MTEKDTKPEEEKEEQSKRIALNDESD